MLPDSVVPEIVPPLIVLLDNVPVIVRVLPSHVNLLPAGLPTRNRYGTVAKIRAPVAGVTRADDTVKRNCVVDGTVVTVYVPFHAVSLVTPDIVTVLPTTSPCATEVVAVAVVELRVRDVTVNVSVPENSPVPTPYDVAPLP